MDQRIQAARAQGVTGTPAFYVNDTQVITPGGEGASLADLSTAIDAELAK
jgi:protein-disulfide isomerase